MYDLNLVLWVPTNILTLTRITILDLSDTKPRGFSRTKVSPEIRHLSRSSSNSPAA